MAIFALEPREGRLTELLRLLKPFPGRVEFAARLALICALTALVVGIYQTPSPALTTYVVFFLNKPDRGTSLILSIAMLVLMSVIISATILVAMVVIDQPAWRVASMTTISLGLLFMASASKLRPVGGIVALIVAYALDLLGTVQGGEIATRALLYAWLFVGIPAAVSIGVNLLLAPSPVRLVEQALARRLRLAAAILSGPNEDLRRELAESLRAGNGETQKWLKLALLEKSATREHVASLRQATNSSFMIFAMIDVMDRDGSAGLPSPQRARLTLTLETMARVLDKGGVPVDLDFEEFVDGEPTLSLRAAEAFACLKEALVTFAEVVPDISTPQTTEEPRGFFLPDAFTNPEHIRYALKTTAAAMFCYVLYSLLDWPGIHTCLITCYIVSLGTAAETIEKLTLRIVGCIVGAASGIAAIVYLIPYTTSIGDLMALVFVGAFVSAWFAVGSPRIAYAGFQIAFAFFLCVIQGSGPSFDMVTARDRVIGILLGNVVVYVLFTNVWPVSIGKRVDVNIAALLRSLTDLLTTAGRPAPLALALHAQETLGSVQQDLDLALYEPPSVRHSDGWIGVRQRVAQEVGALFGPLLLAARSAPRYSSEIAARLDRLAANLDADHKKAPPSEIDGCVASDGASNERLELEQLPFRLPIDRHLNNLEEAFELECENKRKVNYASA